MEMQINAVLPIGLQIEPMRVVSHHVHAHAEPGMRFDQFDSVAPHQQAIVGAGIIQGDKPHAPPLMRGHGRPRNGHDENRRDDHPLRPVLEKEKELDHASEGKRQPGGPGERHSQCDPKRDQQRRENRARKRRLPAMAQP